MILTLTMTTMHNPTTTTTTNPIVAFTTPANYATKLSNLLSLKSLTPLWCPTITTQLTPQTLTPLSLHLSPHSFSLLSAIAFPSRTAISAVSTALHSLPTPLLPPHPDSNSNNNNNNNVFILAALGNDSQLIDSKLLEKFCTKMGRVRVLVPPTATPSAMVRSLGEGRGRRVLCPVPKFSGLDEPPVVPNFLRELEGAGWVPVRVEAYETRWLGPACAEGIVESERLDAIVFTSSAEVEGLLKSLRGYLGWDCWRELRRRRPDLVVAAHGPVTAVGAERLGVDVDVVSSRFNSFDGVVDTVDFRLRGFTI